MLTEMLLWEEVDKIITRRLRLPSYSTWRRRRIKLLAEIRRLRRIVVKRPPPVVPLMQSVRMGDLAAQ